MGLFLHVFTKANQIVKNDQNSTSDMQVYKEMALGTCPTTLGSG